MSTIKLGILAVIIHLFVYIPFVESQLECDFTGKPKYNGKLKLALSNMSKILIKIENEYQVIIPHFQQRFKQELRLIY